MAVLNGKTISKITIDGNVWVSTSAVPLNITATQDEAEQFIKDHSTWEPHENPPTADLVIDRSDYEDTYFSRTPGELELRGYDFPDTIVTYDSALITFIDSGTMQTNTTNVITIRDHSDRTNAIVVKTNPYSEFKIGQDETWYFAEGKDPVRIEDGLIYTFDTSAKFKNLEVNLRSSNFIDGISNYITLKYDPLVATHLNGGIRDVSFSFIPFNPKRYISEGDVAKYIFGNTDWSSKTIDVTEWTTNRDYNIAYHGTSISITGDVIGGQNVVATITADPGFTVNDSASVTFTIKLVDNTEKIIVDSTTSSKVDIHSYNTVYVSDSTSIPFVSGSLQDLESNQFIYLTPSVITNTRVKPLNYIYIEDADNTHSRIRVEFGNAAPYISNEFDITQMKVGETWLFRWGHLPVKQLDFDSYEITFGQPISDSKISVKIGDEELSTYNTITKLTSSQLSKLSGTSTDDVEFTLTGSNGLVISASNGPKLLLYNGTTLVATMDSKMFGPISEDPHTLKYSAAYKDDNANWVKA